MHDAARVRGDQCSHHRHEYQERLRRIDPTPWARVQVRLQRLAFEKLLDDVRRTALSIDIEVEHLNDVGVCDGRRRSRFAQEALDDFRTLRPLSAQNLERDEAASIEILCSKHCAHTAFAQQAGEAVLASDGLADSCHSDFQAPSPSI